MKTTRILSLLFSLSQFILVLKLIEYVRGEEIELAQGNRAPRHFFVAPGQLGQRKRKYRPWLSTSISSTTEETTNFPNSSEIGSYQFEKKIGAFNETDSEISNSSLTKRNDSLLVKKTEVPKQEKIKTTSSTQNPSNVVDVDHGHMARLCPNCANGECSGNVQGTSFPIIPIVVAVIAAIIWFFVFLWIVIGSKKETTTMPSNGYGYGSSSYGAPLPSLTYNNMAKSVNDFLGSEEIGKMTQFILNTLENFSSKIDL